MKSNLITINSRKIDNTIHRSWQCDLLEEHDDLWVFYGTFENEVKHPKLGTIRAGTQSYEYYWKARNYNIFRFLEADGSFMFFYCNINLPPKFENNTLDYVDLDIDILIWPDFTWEVLDMDEFGQNAEKYGYSDEIRKKAKESLEELLDLIQGRSYPFSHSI